MIVAVVVWELHLAGCQSLKDKRKIVKSLKDRLHNQFNVSVAETNHHDLWQRAELACCVVARERRQAESVLESVDRLLVMSAAVRIIDSSKSFL